MLGSDIPSVRLGGIYALTRLAEDHPAQYHIQTIELLCAFARNPTGGKEGRDKALEYAEDRQSHTAPLLREDVQVTLTTIGGCSEAGLGYEKATKGFQLDLRNADLRGADLREANLSGANLTYANLDHADLSRADLSDTILWGTNLSNAFGQYADLARTRIAGTNLKATSLKGANLSGADIKPLYLDPAEHSYMTQAQLDETSADPDNPPTIDGSESISGLAWRPS